jgi:hypothetical protein
MCVLHRCDVYSCVNPDHLFVGTKADNNADMKAKGRDRKRGIRGEENRLAKLTKANVAEIRRRQALGERQGDLGKIYGVTKTTIGDIVKQRTWRGDR